MRRDLENRVKKHKDSKIRSAPRVLLLFAGFLGAALFNSGCAALKKCSFPGTYPPNYTETTSKTEHKLISSNKIKTEIKIGYAPAKWVETTYAVIDSEKVKRDIMAPRILVSVEDVIKKEYERIRTVRKKKFCYRYNPFLDAIELITTPLNLLIAGMLVLIGGDKEVIEMHLFRCLPGITGVQYNIILGPTANLDSIKDLGICSREKIKPNIIKTEKTPTDYGYVTFKLRNKVLKVSKVENGKASLCLYSRIKQQLSYNRPTMIFINYHPSKDLSSSIISKTISISSKQIENEYKRALSDALISHRRRIRRSIGSYKSTSPSSKRQNSSLVDKILDRHLANAGIDPSSQEARDAKALAKATANPSTSEKQFEKALDNYLKNIKKKSQ